MERLEKHEESLTKLLNSDEEEHEGDGDADEEADGEDEEEVSDEGDGESETDSNPLAKHRCDVDNARHHVHKMHMEMMNGWMGVPGNGLAKRGSMRAYGMPEEETTAARTVDSVLIDLQLQEHAAKFHRLGVREVADFEDLEQSELDKIDLTSVEKKRFHRVIATLKSTYK